MVNPSKRFKAGTSHVTSKGIIHIVRHYENSEGVLMTVYRVNDSVIEQENKYNNVVGNIYRWTREGNLNQIKPLKTVRSLKFGIELELVSPISRYDLIEKLSDAGINIESPRNTHSQVSGWKLVHDGSIRTTRKNPYGFELVSPPSTDFKELEIICEILKQEKIKSNTSCGMHVHHEIKELKRQQIIRIYDFYNKYEKVIDTSLPASRENNRFCKPISSIINKVRNCDTKTALLRNIAGTRGNGYYAQCRYYKINLRSFLYYGTIEFRQHSGSISFEEIRDWVLFTHKMIDRAIQINDNVKQFDSQKTILEAFSEMVKELKIEGTKLEKGLSDKLKKQAKKRRIVLA